MGDIQGRQSPEPKQQPTRREDNQGRQESKQQSVASGLKTTDSNHSLSGIWAKASVTGRASLPSRRTLKSRTTLRSSKTSSKESSPSRGLKQQQDEEFHKLMLRRKALEEKNDRRAENFMRRLNPCSTRLRTKKRSGKKIKIGRAFLTDQA